MDPIQRTSDADSMARSHFIVFQRSNQVSRQPGSLTPRALNSLSAITAEHDQDGTEHDWERAMREFTHDEDVSCDLSSSPSIAMQRIGHDQRRSQFTSRLHHFSQTLFTIRLTDATFPPAEPSSY